jgi:hypothetical protein
MCWAASCFTCSVNKEVTIMHALVKAACAIHNLSLAAVYGGPLFAKTAFKTAVKRDIKDEKDRIRVMETAWSTYNKKVNVPAHLAIGVTYLIERRALRNMRLSNKAKALVRVKDVLIAGVLLTGVANAIVGKKLAHELPGGAPKAGDTRSTHTILRKYRGYFKVMGPLNMALVTASIAIGPYIGAAIMKSQRRGLLARILGRK